MSFTKALAEKRSLIPKTGANVVALDTFEPIGEGLYLVEHFENVRDAEACAAKFRKKHPSDPVYVYTPETK